MKIFSDLTSMVSAGGCAALITLDDVRGSSPREAGARLIMRADGRFSGTIGGGALEWQALAEAQALLSRPADGPSRVLDRALGPDLGQCCGGRVRVLVERLTREDLDWLTPLAAVEANGPVVTVRAAGGGPRWLAESAQAAALPPGLALLHLPGGAILERFGADPDAALLFGAGHVGRALALALAPLPFAVAWVDTRPGAFPAMAPGNVTAIRTDEPLGVLADARDGAQVLIMTHSHALDLEIAHAALSARRFAFVGVIGSATKRARFASQLSQAGLPADLVETLVCPIGLPGITGKEPAVIAASMVGQMLQVREQAGRFRLVAKPDRIDTRNHIKKASNHV